MIKRALLAALLLVSGVAQAQLLTKFGPVTGVLVGTAGNPQTAVAAASNITPLFSCSADTSHFLNGLGTCTIPAGTGVTSVAQTVPAGFAISGSPVTSTGTLALSYATGQTANRFLATPDGTTGALSLRALVAGDVPPINLGSTTNGGVSPATILLGTNGGTSNGFFSVTGPTTALRTFTFPNTSATVLTDNAAVTVPQGGTGVGTLTNHGLLVGGGTGSFTALSVGALDNVLMGVTGAAPSFAAVPPCGDGTHAISYNTTTHAWGCQTITSGGTGTVTNVASGTGITGGPITSTGTLSIDQTAALSWSALQTFSANGTNGAALLVSSVNPGLVFNTTGAGSDQKNWRAISTATDLTFDSRTDANGAGRTWLDVGRGTGVAIASIALGNSTDNPSVTINGRNVGASINCTTACSAAGLQVGQSVTINKGSTTTRTSTTTVSLDPDLQVTNLPAGTYTYSVGLFWSALTGGGMQVGPTYSGTIVGGSGGTTSNGIVFQSGCSPTQVQVWVVTTSTASLSCGAGTGSDNVLAPNAPFSGSTSGTFGLTWAQNTSSGTGTTLSPQSWLTLTRIQ